MSSAEYANQATQSPSSLTEDSSPQSATQGMERPYGLKPTLRQAMILTVAFAVILTVDQELVRSYRATGAIAATFLTILVGPCLLGALIITLDQHSPVKYWMGMIIAIFSGPLFLIYFDAVGLANWLHGGIRPNFWFAALLNLFVAGCFGVCWKVLRP